jgi:hypothetical protein
MKKEKKNGRKTLVRYGFMGKGFVLCTSELVEHSHVLGRNIIIY